MCLFCLDTVPLFEGRTDQNLAEAFQDILCNVSNFVCGMELLKWIRVSRFEHNLNLTVNQALKLVVFNVLSENVIASMRCLIEVGRKTEICIRGNQI